MMNTAYYGDEAPIAALATARGQAALDMIRVSGTGSIDRMAPAFSNKEKLLHASGNTLVHGWIRGATGEDIDEVVVSVYRAPRSYTGEDALDISCHGGGAAAAAILKQLTALGFREALKGEFTFRAFINGKLDLTRCESVMELVSAKTESSLKRAAGRLAGLLEAELRRIKELLIPVLAETELLLDYSEEDGVPSPEDSGPGQSMPGRKTVEEALGLLKKLSASYTREKLYQNGALIVIAGPPNAGKSSLFNYLLREERSIVTELPGTTRDWIESWISLRGIPIRLVDTAGIQDSTDRAEQLGIERSRELIDRADLVLYILDRGISGEDRRAFLSPLPLLPVWNKSDLVPLPASFPENTPPILGVSAKSGEGIAELETAIVKALEQSFENSSNDGLRAGIATERQKFLVERALSSLAGALELAGSPLDLIAPLLRDSVDALGEITGEVSNADILDLMFSSFCVGK